VSAAGRLMRITLRPDVAAAGADRGGSGRGNIPGSRHQRRWLRLAQNHAFDMRVNVEGRRAEKTY
jgi:hypothetical protein